MVAGGLASRGRGAGGEGRRGVGRGLPGALARAVVLVLLALCAALTAPTTASTDEAQDAGITVNLHDYTADAVNYGAGWSPLEQTMHALRFGDGDKTNDSVNRWTNSEAVLSGILQDTLVNGYPALSTGRLSDSQLDGESLAYLFNPQDTSQSGVRHCANVSGLLRQDADGYWYYSANDNYACDKYEVDITNADIEVTQGDGSSSTQSGATTDVISVADNAYVVFGNSIVADNAFNLRVQKTGSVPEEETFYARVQVGSLDYVGEYTVYDASGSEVRTASTSNGVIELKTGQYAEIVGLAGGNTVSVYEVTSSGVPIAALTLLGVAVVAGLGASWALARRAVRRRPAHMGRRARRG